MAASSRFLCLHMIPAVPAGVRRGATADCLASQLRSGSPVRPDRCVRLRSHQTRQWRRDIFGRYGRRQPRTSTARGSLELTAAHNAAAC